MSERAPVAGTRLEFQRENLLVGLFVIGALAIFAIVALVALQERLFHREYRLNTSLERIESLRSGSEVRLRGYPVGRVTEITLHTSPEVRFDVEFTVEESIRLPAGTRALLTTSGFVNQVLYLVTPGDPMVPDAPPAGRTAVYLEPGATLPGSVGASIDTLFSDALALARDLSVAVENADTLLNRKLGPGLESALASLSRDLDTLLPQLERAVQDGRSLLRQSDRMLAENGPRLTRLVDAATEEIRTAGDLARRLDGMLAELEVRLLPMTDNLGATLETVNGLLSKADEELTEGEVREILENVRILSEQGTLLVEELRKRPWRLLRRVRGEKKALIEEMEERRRLEEEAEASSGEDTP